METKIKNNIYELELHEIMILENIECMVQRVPNGWNYIYENGIQFVKYDSEFKFKKEFKNVNFKDALAVVCSYFELDKDFYLQPNRTDKNARAKMIIAFILYYYGGMKEEELSEKLNYRNHSSITHARRTIKRLILKDKKFRTQFDQILNRFDIKYDINKL
jgi:hypothetical protein